MKKITLFLTLTLALCTSARLNAANFTSTNSGNWTFSGTWTITSGTDADGIPDGDDDVTIESSVTLTRTVFPKSLTFTTTSGSLKGRYAVIVGTLTMSGGILGNDGDVEVTSRLDCTGGRIGDLIGISQTFLLVSGQATFGGQGITVTKKKFILFNNSVTTWTSGDFEFLENVSMEVMSTATLNVTNNNSCGIFSNFGSTCKVDINGKLNIINSRMFPLIPLSSTGTIKLTGSSATTTSLALSRGGTITGSIECGEFTSVSFNDFFSYTMTNTALSGLGGLTVSASGILSMFNVASTIKTISVLGNLTVSGTSHSGDLASGGSLGIGTALTIGGSFYWFGGTIISTASTAGTLNVSDFSSITGGTKIVNNVHLNLNGAEWNSGDIILNNSKLNSSNIFAVNRHPSNADDFFSIYSTNGSPQNSSVTMNYLSIGLLLRTVVVIKVPFTCTETLNIHEGNLFLHEGGSRLGLVTIKGDIGIGSSLVFVSGTFNLSVSVFQGTGALQFGPNAIIVGTFVSKVKQLTSSSNIILTSDAEVHNLDVYKGKVQIPDDITIQGDLNWQGGNISGSNSGGFSAMPTTKVTVNGVAIISENTLKKLTGKKLILTQGGTWTSGDISLENGSSIDIPIDKTLINNSILKNTIHNVGADNVLNIQGIFTKQGTKTLECLVPIVNSGTINVNNESLLLKGGCTNSGVFNVSTSGNLSFLSTTTGLNSSSLTGTGTLAFGADVNITGGSFNSTFSNIDILSNTTHFNGTFTHSGNLTLTNGTFSHNGNAAINGNLIWKSGTIGNATAANITVANPVNFTEGGIKTLKNRTLTLSQGGTWTGGNINLENGGVINIPISKTLTINHLEDFTLTNSGSGNAVQINGNLNKEGIGNLTVDAQLTNSGAVNVEEGNLILTGGGTQSGTFNSNVTYGIQLNGTNTYTLQNSATFTGTGTAIIAANTNTEGSFNASVAELAIRDATFNCNGSFTQTGGLNTFDAALITAGNITIGGYALFNLNTRIGESSQATQTEVRVAGDSQFGDNVRIIKKKIVLSGINFIQGSSLSLENGSILEIPVNVSLSTTSPNNTVHINNVGTDNSIIVNGTFEKSGESDEVYIDVPIINSGAVKLRQSVFFHAPYSGNGKLSNQYKLTVTVPEGFSYNNPILSNNGTIETPILQLNGAIQQTIEGYGTITNLTLNNPNGLVLADGHNIENLTMQKGMIELQDYDLIVSNNLTGFNSSQYIRTNSSGNLVRPVQATPVVFPIGQSNYTPATISQATNTNDYYVRVSDGIDITHPLVGTAYVKKEWNISGPPTTGNTDAATIKLEWNTPTDEGVGFLSAAARMLHYNDVVVNWERLPQAGTTVACATGMCSLTQTGVLNFSPFAIGLPATVLAAELIDFKAITHKSTVDLLWQTASEKDVSHFDIEQSTDGLTFSKIGETKAAGKANAYIFNVEGPLSIRTYFRLKIVNSDGSFTYSKVLSVAFGKDLSVKAFPNPIQNELSIDVVSESKQLVIEVIDVLGRSIYQKNESNTEGSKLLTINTLEWLSGIYFLKVSDGKKVFQQKIVKR
jgi:hypothetical protein